MSNKHWEIIERHLRMCSRIIIYVLYFSVHINKQVKTVLKSLTSAVNVKITLPPSETYCESSLNGPLWILTNFTFCGKAPFNNSNALQFNYTTAAVNHGEHADEKGINEEKNWAAVKQTKPKPKFFCELNGKRHEVKEIHKWKLWSIEKLYHYIQC